MPPPHYNVFCGCLYASCIVVMLSYDADVFRSKLSLYMHTSRPLVEHRTKKGGKELRSDSPPELKEEGVASILELLSVSTLYIADTTHRIPLDSYFPLHIADITHRPAPDTYFPSFFLLIPLLEPSSQVYSILGLTCRCDRRSNSHPRRPPHNLPQVSKPKPKPTPSHTIQQHTPEIHLRPLIIQTTSSATSSLHPTYLTLRSAL